MTKTLSAYTSCNWLHELGVVKYNKHANDTKEQVSLLVKHKFQEYSVLTILAVQFFQVLGFFSNSLD